MTTQMQLINIIIIIILGLNSGRVKIICLL